MAFAAAGTSIVGLAPGVIWSKVRVSSVETLAKKAGSTRSSICWLKSSSARQPLNSSFSLTTVLNFDVTYSPWKLY